MTAPEPPESEAEVRSPLLGKDPASLLPPGANHHRHDTDVRDR
jgi:hypothetical protein